MKWESEIAEVADIQEAKKNHQHKLGEIASRICKEAGADGLREFIETYKEINGTSLPFNTLRNYAWVYDKTHELELPEDLSYRALQYIASSGDPPGWARKVKELVLTSAEVCKMLRKEKGLPEKKTVICKVCGNVAN